MSGPGDIVAGLAPPQENPPAVAFRKPGLQLVASAEKTEPLDPETTEGGLGDEQAAPNPVGLAGYIMNSWSRNKRARDLLETRLLDCLRARRGEYDPGYLGDAWTNGAGDPIYLPAISTKMRSAEAAFNELLLPSGNEKPWGLDPRTDPQLPEQLEAQLAEQALQEARQQMAAASQGPDGKVVDIKAFSAMALKAHEHMIDEHLAKVREEAKTRAQRMEDVIDTRLQDGDYYSQALPEFIHNFCTFPTAILKGPFLSMKKRFKWTKAGQGYKAVVEHVPVKTWAAVSPLDCYPAPGARNCQDGDFIERIRLSRADLFDMIGLPGYSETGIRSVLASQSSGGLRYWLWNDAERRQLEGQTHDVWIPDYLVDALHWWGSVSGRDLTAHGVTVNDMEAYYEVDAILIGNEVIRCAINSHPLGERPYHRASYDEVPGAFWGNGIYDLGADCQGMINACVRALNANMGLAAGPIQAIDMAQLAAGQDPKSLRPLQQLLLDRSRSQGSQDAVTFYQAESRANDLLKIAEWFEQRLDLLTGIPRYQEGDSNATGAAQTLGGLSMLMSNAAKGLRRAVANVDRGVVEPSIRQTFEDEMLFNPDDSIKGDCRCVARGSAALIVKEHLQATRTQFLSLTNNPTDLAIIGTKRRRNVLALVAQVLDMPVDDVVPSESEMDAQMAKQPPPEPTPDEQLRAKVHVEGQQSRERIAGAQVAARMAISGLRPETPRPEPIPEGGDGVPSDIGPG